MPLQTLRAHLLCSIFLRRMTATEIPRKAKRSWKTTSHYVSLCHIDVHRHVEPMNACMVSKSIFEWTWITVAKLRLRHVSRPVSPNGLGRTVTSGDQSWNWWKRGPDNDGNWSKEGSAHLCRFQQFDQVSFQAALAIFDSTVLLGSQETHKTTTLFHIISNMFKGYLAAGICSDACYF